MIDVLATSSAGTSALYGIASALGSLVIVAVLKWGKDQLIKNLNEGRAEINTRLDSIVKQVTETNGDVTHLKESEVSTRERLGKVEGRVDTMTQLMTKTPIEK